MNDRNPGGTLSGNDVVLCVIDDPIGCVVPSPNVIINPRGAKLSYMPKGSDHYVDIGTCYDLRIHEMEIRKDFVFYPAPPAMGKTRALNTPAQRARLRRPAKMSGIKGLR